jgi:hypothetical protein
MEGARALCGLSSLAKLELGSRDRVPTDDKAVEFLLNSFSMLEDLTISVSALTVALAHSLAHHPSLTRLTLRPESLDVTPLATLVSESKSISSLTVLCVQSVAVPHECLRSNVHLLDTNLFDARYDLDDAKRRQVKHKHEARNRRLLHNWQCICVLLASYRANAHSPIRDSMLSLMVDVMSFLVPDEWCVERCV